MGGGAARTSRRSPRAPSPAGARRRCATATAVCRGTLPYETRTRPPAKESSLGSTHTAAAARRPDGVAGAGGGGEGTPQRHPAETLGTAGSAGDSGGKYLSPTRALAAGAPADAFSLSWHKTGTQPSQHLLSPPPPPPLRNPIPSPRHPPAPPPPGVTPRQSACGAWSPAPPGTGACPPTAATVAPYPLPCGGWPRPMAAPRQRRRRRPPRHCWLKDPREEQQVLHRPIVAEEAAEQHPPGVGLVELPVTQLGPADGHGLDNVEKVHQLRAEAIVPRGKRVPRP